MSERWKYQIRTGGIYGLILSFVLDLFDSSEMSFNDAFFRQKSIIRLVYFLLIGIFIVGYSGWKKKVKRETTLSDNYSVNE